ncbi:hypothetical protein RCL_jg9831.t1 [Rhizophagus clarus]|uniref:Uncharacterized protein n=1 Tax=Rhizophagus clarus TaxID=94130 RepID=A0A8H3R042_9GLOM|nr:hypothetical protein RCL_jg9831.t1 [Rhizophagus clarus]
MINPLESNSSMKYELLSQLVAHVYPSIYTKPSHIGLKFQTKWKFVRKLNVAETLSKYLSAAIHTVPLQLCPLKRKYRQISSNIFENVLDRILLYLDIILNLSWLFE